MPFVKSFKNENTYIKYAKKKGAAIQGFIVFPILFYLINHAWISIGIGLALLFLGLEYLIWRSRMGTFITFVKITESNVTVKYSHKGEEHVLCGSIGDIKFKKVSDFYSRNPVSILKVIVNGKVFLKQYELGDWTEEDIYAILIAQNPELAMKK